MKLRVAILLGAALMFAVSMAAQDPVKVPGEQPKVVDPAQAHFYRLEYTVREMDGSKMLSKRSYSVGLRADGARREMRTGSRVPVATGSFQPGGGGISPLVNTQFQYIDVGVNIDSRAREEGDGLGLEVTADMSSIAGEGVPSSLGNNPIIRQVRGTAAVTVPLGKPTAVFTADDPASGHRFELEVVATKVK